MGSNSPPPLYVRILSPIIETAVEDVGLVFWFIIQKMGGLYFAGLSGVALYPILVAEHIISQTNHVKDRPNPDELKKIFAFSLVEVSIWIIWLYLLYNVSTALAAIFFIVGLYVEHQLTYNTKHARDNVSFFHLSKRPAIILGIFVFTIFEVGGAGLWVFLADSGRQIEGVVALVVGSLIEHNLAGIIGRIKEQ